jgi:hypothetical protein
MKKAALITVHGMGIIPENYNKELIKKLHARLGSKFDDLYVGSVYYQGILMDNEQRVWNSVAARVKWHALRKFLLFGFGDAAGLENGKESTESVYAQAQTIIARELYKAKNEIGANGTILIIAQSLGCQVVSCYFWDAKCASEGKTVSKGIWRNIKEYELEISGSILTSEDITFLQGSSFHYFMTTGSNIPIFVAAHAMTSILPITPNNKFKWDNYYYQNDVLGWPLADLSTEYANIVIDHQIKVYPGFIGWILTNWNPISHLQYWKDNEVLSSIESTLQTLL